MRKLKKYLVLFIMCYSVLLLAQTNRSNVWYFGENAGVDFNFDPPQALTNGQMIASEGCSTISDKNGQLLIYTDGSSIWNKNHQVIPGAINLGGKYASTQTAIIVPMPKSNHLLYVFTIDAREQISGLYYTLIDLRLNSGAGGVIEKKKQIHHQSSEKIIAIKQCNNDFWIIAHEKNNSNFLIWQLTEIGLSATPKIQNEGTSYGMREFSGYLTASVDGSKIATISPLNDFIDIFDFDIETGVIKHNFSISNDRTIDGYGIAFSPNGKLLYYSKVFYPVGGEISQIDLSLSSTFEIINSEEVIAKTDAFFGAIQLARNGKLYVAHTGRNFLSEIANPNAKGARCNFVFEGVLLKNKQSLLGLPNLISNFNEEIDSVIKYIKVDPCLHQATLTLDLIPSSLNASYEWYFQKNKILTEKPTIIVDESGTYELIITIIEECNDSVTIIEKVFDFDVNLPEVLSVPIIIIQNPSCQNHNGQIVIEVTGGLGPLEYSIDGGISYSNNHIFNNLLAKTYNIVIKDANGCEIYQSISLRSEKSPNIIILQTTREICEMSNASIKVEGQNGVPPYMYSIDDINYGSINTFLNLKGKVKYKIYIIDANGCKSNIDFLLEKTKGPGIREIKINSTTCGLSNGELLITTIDGTEPIVYSIDGITFHSTSHFVNLESGNYTISVKDINGCTQSTKIIINSETSIKVQEISIKNTTCDMNNGSIRINASGNLLEYSISGNDFTDQSSFDDLSAGTYELVIKDENNCLERHMVDILDSYGFTIIKLISTPSLCGNKNGQVTIIIDGGELPYETLVDHDMSFEGLHIYNLSKGEHFIQIKDNNGCHIDTVIQIFNKPCSIYIPNSFSPNGDGVNDFFRIYTENNNEVLIHALNIYDRWGNKVYSKNEYNINYQGWNGQFKGKAVLPAAYVYLIEVKDNEGNIQIYEGNITLMR